MLELRDEVVAIGIVTVGEPMHKFESHHEARNVLEDAFESSLGLDSEHLFSDLSR